MAESIEKQLEMVKEAIISWEKGELHELSALIAIHMTLFPQKPSDEAMRWAMDVLRNDKKE